MKKCDGVLCQYPVVKNKFVSSHLAYGSQNLLQNFIHPPLNCSLMHCYYLQVQNLTVIPDRLYDGCRVMLLVPLERTIL